MTIEEYLKRKPYKNPEILVFETIPKTFGRYSTNDEGTAMLLLPEWKQRVTTRTCQIEG